MIINETNGFIESTFTYKIYGFSFNMFIIIHIIVYHTHLIFLFLFGNRANPLAVNLLWINISEAIEQLLLFSISKNMNMDKANLYYNANKSIFNETIRVCART